MFKYVTRIDYYRIASNIAVEHCTTVAIYDMLKMLNEISEVKAFVRVDFY